MAKLTKKDYFAKLYSLVENLDNVQDKHELLGFIDHEVELLEKKASAKTQTKTQKENIGIKDIILDVVYESESPMTITDMLANPNLNGYTNQKISALCKQLVDVGLLVKLQDKKKTYFAKP